MHKKTILIVEDDKDMMKIYEEMFGNKYHLWKAFDADEARKFLDKDHVDLMILDIILPKETGDTFFVRLRSHPKYAHVKTIVVTVMGDITEQMQRIDPDVVCLSKPFEKEKLLKLVEERLKD